MGCGADLRDRYHWQSAQDFHRLLNLISSFGLSLWPDVLFNQETAGAAQVKNGTKTRREFSRTNAKRRNWPMGLSQSAHSP